MAVDDTDRKSTQSMTAALTEFDFTFRALVGVETDIKCIRKVTATTTEVDMTYDADLPTGSSIGNILKYTVTINDGGDGGTIRVGYPSTSCTVTIYRETTDTQASAYDDYNQFPADTVESDFDKRTMVTQELSEGLTRTIRLPITSSADAELPTPEADTFLGWNSTGDGIENKTLPDPSVLVQASEAEAIAGTNNVKFMTPLRTKQGASTVSTITITTKATIALAVITNVTASTLNITTQATIALLTITTTGSTISCSTIAIASDIHSVGGAWADYGATSTIVGWSSADPKYIYTKKIGKMVFVAFNIQGTSNSTTATFTLPYTSSNTIDYHAVLPYAYDNGAVVAMSNLDLPKNSATVTCYKTPATAGGWTNSGGKRVIGQFCYESA